MMKHKAIYQRFLLLAALPAFMLASCSQEEMGSGPDAQNGEIRFEIGFAPQNEAMQTDAQTRVSTDTQFNSTWEAGDQIGVFAVEHGTELAASGNPIHNVKLTYSDGSWIAEEGIYWPKNSTKYDFYAYYPYDDAVTAATSILFKVHTDQSAATRGKSNYNLSDLLTARNTNANGCGKGETVQLAFTHALAMVEVNVSKSMIGEQPADILKVWLNGCVTEGVLNLPTQFTRSFDDAASPEKIKMYPCPNDDAPGIYAYRALVPAQELAKGTVMFSFEYDGSTHLRSGPLTKPLSLKAGGAEKFDITFPFTPGVVTANVSSDVRLAQCFTKEKLATITLLKVMGKMTEADFNTIKDNMPALINLDLNGATVEGNSIPAKAFSGKKDLKMFFFPQGITSIGKEAFKDCSGLTGSLTIPAGVQTIGMGAFAGCSGFNGSLTIPESVTSIDNSAFMLCRGLTSITCYIQNPLDVYFHRAAFALVPPRIPVHVPEAALGDYQKHAAWKTFKNWQSISQP